MPLRVLVKTAITAVTPPVVFNSFPLPVRHTLTAVEPPRDRRRVAILLVRDCTAVVLRRHGGDGGATAVLVWCHGGHGGATAVMAMRRHGGDGGATAVLVRCHGGHGGATAVMAMPRRSHCGLAQPAGHCGSFEHVQSFRRASAKVRSFDSFQRCDGDQ